jgi:threonine dehydrogenase-like Zn-dependent dehydrogenase
MYSAYLDLSPARVRGVRALGLVSRRSYFGPLAPLRVRRFPTPALPGPRWVRVRNAVSSIALDEIERILVAWDPKVAPQATPQPARVYLGRQVVGEVVEAGSETQFVRVGDRVVYRSGPCCASHEIEPPCQQCAMGSYALCENRFLPGLEQVGGGWSDEMIVHEAQLFLTPDGLANEQAALLEPAAEALRAALRYHPEPDDQALILGAETPGLLLTQALRALAPTLNITVAPQQTYQVEVATRMGSTRILYPEDGDDAVARMTEGKLYHNRAGAQLLVGGFDVVYDTLGTETSLRQALLWAREGGVVILSGRPQRWLRLDPTLVWSREVALLGVVAHGAESLPGGAELAPDIVSGGRIATFTLAAQMMREKLLTPERLVTHRFPLKEVRAAVATMRDRAEHKATQAILDIRDVASASLIADTAPPAALGAPGSSAERA